MGHSDAIYSHFFFFGRFIYGTFIACSWRRRPPPAGAAAPPARFARAGLAALRVLAPGGVLREAVSLRLVLRGGRGSLLLLRLLPLAKEARDFQRNPLKRPTMRELEAVLTAERL